MQRVFSVGDRPWRNLRDLPGARGYEYKTISDESYTTAFNSELVRLQPGDHSVPHVEPWNHLLYFLSGSGEVTVEGRSWAVAEGTVCLVKAGERHSLRNPGPGDMVVFVVYDPPRVRGV